jgi:hypothetical protein
MVLRLLSVWENLHLTIIHYESLGSENYPIRPFGRLIHRKSGDFLSGIESISETALERAIETLCS